MQAEEFKELTGLDLVNKFHKVGTRWSKCMAIEVGNLLTPEPDQLATKQDNAHRFFIEMVTEMIVLTKMPSTWLNKADDLWKVVVTYQFHNLIRRWIVSAISAFLDVFIKVMQGFILGLDQAHAEEVIRFMEQSLEPYEEDQPPAYLIIQ